MMPAPMAAPSSTRPSRAILGGLSRGVLDRRHAGVARAARAAEEVSARFHPVAHDLAAAVLARRRQAVDRAFEGVEGMGGAGRHDLERLVVIVTTDFTSSHGRSPPAARIRAFAVPLRRLPPALELRQDLARVKAHEAFLIRADLVDAHVVEARLGVLADGLQMAV